MKAVCKLAAAGLLLALLAGCGGRGAWEWAVEPCVEADKIEPLAVSGGGALEGSLPETESLQALCTAQQGELWGLVDGRTGEWILDPQFSDRPVLCPAGHLILRRPGSDSIVSDPTLDQTLAAYDPDLQTEPGHGGFGAEYVWDEATGQVYRHTWNECGSDSLPLDGTANGELLPVRRGVWRYSPLDGTQVMMADEKSRYAAASADGTLLTDFIYEQARPGSGGLIAVQTDSKWGYLDGQGNPVIPCKYDGVWGQSSDLDAQGHASAIWQRVWPAPCLSGRVVVRRGGEYALLNGQGQTEIRFGAYEALAPAPDGLVWAKEGGRWGLLRPISDD